MNIPENVVKVFIRTGHDVVAPDHINVRIPIPDVETKNVSIMGCCFTKMYFLHSIECGTEGVVFGHYKPYKPELKPLVMEEKE